MTLWSLIVQTDAISKSILFSLLLLSFISWTLALYKLNVLKLKIKQLKQAQPLLFHLNSLDDMIGRAATLENTFAGELLAHYLTDLKKTFKFAQLQNQIKNSVHSPVQNKRLSQSDFERLNKNIEQTAINALEAEEHNMPIFSTLAQVAPLLGLFGTVWGLIHAFMSIAHEGQIDIATIAPGIAEALITTLAGLVVAIPALTLFNYILSKIRIFEQQVIALTQGFLDAIQGLVVFSNNQSYGPNNHDNSAEKESVYARATIASMQPDSGSELKQEHAAKQEEL